MRMIKKNTVKKRNPANSNDKERNREIDDYIATGKMKKIEGSGGTGISFSRKSKVIRMLTRENCPICGSWTDSSGEYRHYDWCSKYKKSRKNPIPDLIKINHIKSSKDDIYLEYKNKEIEFTGRDAVKIRDLLKTELKKFKNSPMLQSQYPGSYDIAGGFYLYITEILKYEYPDIFR